MSKKKLLILTNLFPSRWAPNKAAFNYQQFSRLAEEYDVKMIVPVPFLEYIKNFRHIREHSFGKFQIKYLCFFYIPRFFRYLHGFFLFLSVLFILGWVRKGRFEVIFGSWVYPDGFVSVLLAKIFRIPVFIKVHGSDINVFSRDSLRRYQIAYALKSCSFVLSVSEDLKKKMILLGVPENKINVIYNGVDKEIFRPMPVNQCRESLGLGQNLKLILFVGNIIESKGIRELMEAFLILDTRHKNLAMVVIGDGSGRKMLERKYSDRLNDSGVMFTGRLDLEEISMYMSASDILCLPSYNEGVPNVLLESMACGIPVVATNVGGIPEIITDDDGVLVEPENIDDLARGLEFALQKKWDKTKIVKSAMKYSWEENINKIDKEIRKYTLDHG